jgi:hypothetical protein
MKTPAIRCVSVAALGWEASSRAYPRQRRPRSGPGWLHEIKHDGFLGNWNMGIGKMTDSGGLSWEAQEVFQKIKSFNRLPGGGIPLIQLNMSVGSAKTVKKGIPELKSAGLITNTVSGEPTLTDKGYKTLV